MPVNTNERPHKLRVAANAVIVNDRNEVLLHRRSDDNSWSIPGGGVELCESVPQACLREAREETGLEVEIIRLVGVYSRPDDCTYKYENGDIIQYVAIGFLCRPVGGRLQENAESLELRYFPANAFPESLRPAHRRRILDALNGTEATWKS